jgi:hypothetical protein
MKGRKDVDQYREVFVSPKAYNQSLYAGTTAQIVIDYFHECAINVV